MTEYNGEQIDAVLDRVEVLTDKCDSCRAAMSGYAAAWNGWA